jgi:hypothetical protein
MVVAAAVLAFDGMALALLGWWSGRWTLLLVGLVFFASSGVVVLSWRWYRHRMRTIADARQALADDAREMQRMLRER